MNFYDGVYLAMLPVCECGEILRDAYTCERLNERKDGTKYVSVKINPACCPFCGHTIMWFNIKYEYLNMFGGE